MNRRLCLALLAGLAGVAWGAEPSPFEDAGEVSFFSLRPEPLPDNNDLPRLGEYPILGERDLTSEESQTVLAAVQAGLDQAGEQVHTCFLPRHALAWKARGHVYFLLICFQCQRVHWQRDFGDWRGDEPISPNAKSAFLAIHKRYDIPLAE